MKRAPLFLALLVLGFASAGCDSVDRENDSERLQGNWSLTGVQDEERNRTAEFGALGSLRAEFDEPNYTFRLTPPEGESQDLLAGTYTLETVSNRLILRAQAQGADTVVPLTYRFVDDETIELTFPSSLFKLFFPQLGFVGNVTFTLKR